VGNLFILLETNLSTFVVELKNYNIFGCSSKTM